MKAFKIEIKIFFNLKFTHIIIYIYLVKYKLKDVEICDREMRGRINIKIIVTAAVSSLRSLRSKQIQCSGM